MDNTEQTPTTDNKVEFEKTEAEVTEGKTNTTQIDTKDEKSTLGVPEGSKSVEELETQHHRVRKQPGGGTTFSFF